MTTPLQKPGPNAYLDDPLLCEFAAQAGLSETAEFGSLGGFVASPEAQNLVRLSDAFPSRCADGVMFDVHPGFQILERRAIQSRLHSMLFVQTSGPEALRHCDRAVRLILHGTLDTAHVRAAITSSAALAVLSQERQLYREWAPLLTAEKLDTGDRAPREKAGLLASFAVLHPAMGDADQRNRAERGGNGLFRVSGRYPAVRNPMADGWIAAAVSENRKRVFFVPRRLGDGSLNGVRIAIEPNPFGGEGDGLAQLTLVNAIGQEIAAANQGGDLFSDCALHLQRDAIALIAGQFRTLIGCLIDGVQRDDTSVRNAVADMILDWSGVLAVAMRLARASDEAKSDPVASVEARLLAPVARQMARELLVRAGHQALRMIAETGVRPETRLLRIARRASLDTAQPCPIGGREFQQFWDALAHAAGTLDGVLEGIGYSLGALSGSTTAILKAAARLAQENGQHLRLFGEQFYLAAAGAELVRADTGVLADAFIDARLGGRWSVGYGVLDARHDAALLIDSLYPAR